MDKFLRDTIVDKIEQNLALFDNSKTELIDKKNLLINCLNIKEIECNNREQKIDKLFDKYNFCRRAGKTLGFFALLFMCFSVTNFGGSPLAWIISSLSLIGGAVGSVVAGKIFEHSADKQFTELFLLDQAEEVMLEQVDLINDRIDDINKNNITVDKRKEIKDIINQIKNDNISLDMIDKLYEYKVLSLGEKLELYDYFHAENNTDNASIVTKFAENEENNDDNYGIMD